MTNCSRCGSRAEIAICSLVATKGVSPRRQKCSCAVSLCKACMQALSVADGAAGLLLLKKPLIDAYAAITDNSVNSSDRNRQ